VLTSGSLEPVIDPESNGRHSVFALALINALRENTNVIDGTALYNKVQSNMRLVTTSQNPGYANINKVTDESGDFLFIHINYQINGKPPEHLIQPEPQFQPEHQLQEDQRLEEDDEQDQSLEEDDEADQLIEEDDQEGQPIEEDQLLQEGNE
jgi:hypothetical protein